MKKLLLTFLLLSSVAIAQEKRDCPTGFKWFGEESFDYNYWVVNDCIPDSSYSKLMCSIEELACMYGRGEVFIDSTYSEAYSYWEGGDWDKAKCECKRYRKWEIRKDEGLIEVTEEEYNKFVNNNK